MFSSVVAGGTTSVLCLLLLTSAVGLLAVTLVASSRVRRRSIMALHRGQDGGAYTVGLLVVIPTFVTLLAVFIESSGLMLARIGLEHAAFAAARSAIVWAPVDRSRSATARRPWATAIEITPDAVDTLSSEEQALRERCRLSVAKAMAPFVSGSPLHGPETLPGAAESHATAFATSAGESLGASHGADYLAQKFRNAYFATRVGLSVVNSDSNRSDTQVAIDVRFYAPIGTPGVGRLIGQPATQVLGEQSQHYVFAMVSGFQLSIERPVLSHAEEDRFAMGVRYGE